MGTNVQKGWMEQRKFERVATTLTISFRILEGNEGKESLEHSKYSQTTAAHLPQLAQKFHVYHAVTRDISAGGLSITGEQAFTMGQHVEIFLELPPNRSRLTLLAEVCRAGSFFEMGKTMYSAGVKLLALNREDMTKLGNFMLAEKLRQESTKRG
jgi:hypothetical protein